MSRFHGCRAGLVAGLMLASVAAVSPSTAASAASGTIVVRASGVIAGKVGPKVEVWLAGAKVAGFEVRATSLTDYSVPVADLQGAQRLEIRYTNDAVVSRVDRNLRVFSITVGGHAIHPTATPVRYDRGAIDGVDVVEGTESVNTGGALVLETPTTLQGGDHQIAIDALGLSSTATPPLAIVVHNGKWVGSAKLTPDNAYHRYAFAVPTLASGDSVDVEQRTASSVAGDIRYFYLASASFDGVNLASTASSVTYDRGPLDGQDVVAGTDRMEWNGAMRFVVPVGGGTGGGDPGASACANTYQAGFTLPSIRTQVNIAPLPEPAKGTRVIDPEFGTCYVRVTDHDAEPPTVFARNDYSRRQAFNADSTKLFVYASGGLWHLYDALTYDYLAVLPGLAGDAEPQWDPVDPNLLYYLPTNGVGMTVHRLNISTMASQVVGDLGPRLKAIWPDAMAAWTKSEGSPSADGRWWCLMVDGDNWAGRGMVVWDKLTDTITASRSVTERPDFVSMSPSGNYCIESGDGLNGTRAWTKDFSSATQLHHKAEHSDLALDAAGDDVHVSIDFQANGGPVFMVNLRTGVRTEFFPTYINGTTTSIHISGKAFAKPGWALLSTYDTTTGQPREWAHKRVMALELKPGGRVLSLAHHRMYSPPRDEQLYPGAYWAEPHASVNRNFTRVVWNSNWGNLTNFLDIDTYMAVLPSTALPS